MKTKCVIERAGIPAVIHANLPVVIPRQRSLQDWADYIVDGHRREIEAILLKGRRLWEAKAALLHAKKHDDWEKLFKGHPKAVARPIPFSVTTAKMYMKICTDPIISNRYLGNDLPTSWRALYELTFLPEATLVACLRDGLIGPETTPAEVRALRQLVQVPMWSLRARPKTAKRRVELHESLEQSEANLREWVAIEARELAGVVWVQGPFLDVPTSKTPPLVIKHRCECGHEHMDQRTRRRQ